MHTEKDKSEFSQKGFLGNKKTLDVTNLTRSLERDFVADASVDVNYRSGNKVDLVIHLECNFVLSDSLFHLQSGIWGNFSKPALPFGDKQSSFQRALDSLRFSTDLEVEIAELSIHLDDTSIVIMQLPHAPIEDYLYSILNAIHENYIGITVGLGKKPFEIFVPVHEHNDESPMKVVRQNQTVDYLKYWGLYFEDNDNDGKVFDVSKKEIIDGSDCALIDQEF